MTSLLVLDLSNNNLSGNIPSRFGNFNNNLSVLNLRMNKFYGMISLGFVEVNSLSTLNLNGNELEGSLLMPKMPPTATPNVVG